MKDQKNECRKNNIKDEEEDPKEKEVIVADARSQVGVKDLYHVDKYNLTNDVRYGVSVSEQVEGAKNVYSEVSEGWSGVSKLAVDIVSEYVTTPEPIMVPKSIKFSDIVSRCPVDAFEDEVHKNIIATLKKVKENLNKEKIDLRKYNLDKRTERASRRYLN